MDVAAISLLSGVSYLKCWMALWNGYVSSSLISCHSLHPTVKYETLSMEWIMTTDFMSFSGIWGCKKQRITLIMTYLPAVQRKLYHIMNLILDGLRLHPAGRLKQNAKGNKDTYLDSCSPIHFLKTNLCTTAFKMNIVYKPCSRSQLCKWELQFLLPVARSSKISLPEVTLKSWYVKKKGRGGPEMDDKD